MKHIRISYTLAAYEMTGLIIYFSEFDQVREIFHGHSQILFVIVLMLSSLLIGSILNISISFLYYFSNRLFKLYERQEIDSEMKFKINMIMKKYEDTTIASMYKRLEKELRDELYNMKYFYRDLTFGCVIGIYMIIDESMFSLNVYALIQLIIALISILFGIGIFIMIDRQIKDELVNVTFEKISNQVGGIE